MRSRLSVAIKSVLINWWDTNLKFLFYYCFQQKRKLRIFISNTFNPAKPDAEDGEGTVASWELRVEGRLLEDVSLSNLFSL